MSAYWCELAWLGGEAPVPGVLIDVDEQGFVSGVVAHHATTPEATVLPGLTLPGLANAHSHAFQRALRSRAQAADRGSFWTWREQMYALADTLDDDALYRLARATFAEMALAGITLVGEFDYLHRSEALMRAAADAGIRITLLDACYLHGGLERFHDASAHAWAARVDSIEPGREVRLGAAIHSVRAVDPAAAAIVAAFAAERGMPLHAHVSEQPAENEDCLRRHGVSPLALLAGAGAVGERFTAVHATHLLEGDAELLRDAGASVCMCPSTERDLADGIGHPPGPLALGTDSNAVIDVFEEARAVELDERLRTGVRGNHAAAALLGAATGNGYTSLGWPEGGQIATGALADLVSVRLDGPRLAGTRRADALEAVVFAATREDIGAVIVGGRQLALDPAAVAAELSAAIPR